MSPTTDPDAGFEAAPSSGPPTFLRGGGACAALVATRDWSATPLGPITGWPQSLRTATAILLRSPVPMVMLWGGEGVMLYNDAYSVFAGGRHPDLLGSNVREGWPEVAEFNDNVMKVGLAGGTLAYRDQELTLYRHGRPEQVWMNLDYLPVLGENGEPTGVLCVLAEITERKLAEAQLRASEERLRLVVEGATDYAILTLDPERNVTSWSAGAAATFGYAVEEIIGQSGDVLFTPEDRASGQPEREVETARREGMAPDVRWHLHRDGSRVFINGAMRPLRDGSGREIGFLKVGRDETERRAIDERLLAAGERAAADAAERAAILSQLGEGVIVTDAEGQITFVNDAAERLHGIKLLGVSPEAYSDTYHLLNEAGDPYPPHELPLARAVLAGEIVEGALWRIRRPDGSEVLAIGNARPVLGPDGARLGAVLTIRDDTERRAAEAAVRESEVRFRNMADQAPVMMWVTEADGRCTYLNRAWYEFTGQTRQDAEGFGWLEATHPDDKAVAERIFLEANAAHAPFRLEYRLRRYDGAYRWAIDAASPRFGPGGEFLGYVGSVIDIDERREMEEALRELNETLEIQVAERTQERDRAWRLSQELQVVASQDGTLEAVNARWTELLDWREEDLIGTKFAEYVHPDDLDATSEAFAGIIERPLTVPFAYRFRAKDGTYHWFGWTGAFEGGRVYAVGRDLTFEKEQAAELARAEEQLRQAQKMEAVGQLTGGIAHDFNNLLTGITGSLEMMQVRMAQGRTGDVDRYVTAAQGAAKRAAALTHRLLAFSRRQTLAPKPTDIRALVNGMEELIGRSVGPEIEVETVNAAGLWTSLIDPSQLENAVLNLCINARDAMPDGGRITIETGNRWMDRRTAAERGLEPGQYISLCVSDTGTGMSPEIVSRVFEPFFTTKPIGMGTGLGLSMIYGFAKQSGGTVTVYSEVGQGTMVCIYLPRHVGDVQGEAEDVDLAAAPRAEAGETVLVVDDEPTVRMLVAEVLTDLGYTAIEAGDGPAGLKVLNSNARIDLLVTDVGLPGGMNGRQVADAARVVRPRLKVLFITGYAENAVLSHGHLDPGMHVLTKPFSMEALASTIKDVLAS